MSLKIDDIVTGLLPKEASKITKIRQLGNQYSVSYIGLISNNVGSKVISKDDFESLQKVTTDGEFNFSGDPEKFILYTEAERINSAYQFDPLYAINCSVVDALPHQVEAVYRSLLPQPKIRFLLADDTGAGKTIMTGLLIKELLMRHIVERILVVTPGGLTKQWQEDEMGVKFNLSFTLVNRANFAGDPTVFQSNNRVVTSIDFISREDVLNTLEKTSWDLIIFDEAHKLSAYEYGERTYRSKRYEAAERLAKRAEHILLLTATPHRGRADTFKRLMQLLDEDIFATPDLAAERVKEISEDGINKFFIRRLKEDMRDWDGNPLYKERYTQTASYELSHEEKILYDKVTDYLTKRKEEASASKNIHVTLALQVMQRRLVSSIFAIRNTLEKRYRALEGLLHILRENPSLWSQQARLKADDYEDFDNIDEYDDLDDTEREAIDFIKADPKKLKMFTTSKSPADLMKETQEVKTLFEMADSLYGSHQEERKFQELKKLLISNGVVDNGEKLVIFTEHKDTLLYLQNKLQNNGYSVAVIHGGMPVDERRQTQARFRTPDMQILIATDAAGEGINLQFCRLLINWDIPWNPNRLEQRMGRIHRYGQLHDVLVFNIVANNTREGVVLNKLLSKIDLIRQHLGDDRVYDVIQDVMQEVPMDAIIASVFNGDDTAFNSFWNQDESTLKDLFKKSIENQRNRIAHSSVDYTHAKNLKEISDERRLQPIYIRQFFEKTFNHLGGSYEELPGGIFKITRIPEVISRYMKDHYRIYVDGITNLKFFFDKNRYLHHQELNPNAGDAHYINPGNPLFDSLVAVAREKFKTEALKGTILVSPEDTAPYFAFFIANRITDNRDNKNGTNIANEELSLVCTTPEGKFSETSPAKFLDLCPPTELAKKVVAPEPIQEDKVIEWAYENITTKLYQDTVTFVRHDLDLRKSYLSDAFLELINNVNARINELQGSLFFSQDEKIEHDLRDLANRLETYKQKKVERLEEMEEMMVLSPMEPEVLGCAYVVPLTQMEYKSCFGMSRDDEVEEISMKVAMEYETAQNRHPIDVSKENVGYDLRSEDSDNSRRYIEVKGRAGTDGVMLSENEFNRLRQLGSRAWLYIVTDCKTEPKLHLINNPGNSLSVEKLVKGIQYFVPLKEWQDKKEQL